MHISTVTNLKPTVLSSDQVEEQEIARLVKPGVIAVQLGEQDLLFADARVAACVIRHKPSGSGLVGFNYDLGDCASGIISQVLSHFPDSAPQDFEAFLNGAGPPLDRYRAELINFGLKPDQLWVSETIIEPLTVNLVTGEYTCVARHAPSRSPQITTFYSDSMSPPRDGWNSESLSPLKPHFFMEYLHEIGLAQYLAIVGDFGRYTPRDFLAAASPEYVRAFFSPSSDPELAMSNGLPRSRELVHSVCHTAKSLHSAVLHACNNPHDITLSPSSGFHHATYKSGSGFCTFNAPVAAALDIYRKLGMSGAYIDLDAHFGNGIEDSREHIPDLDRAIPQGCNINPQGKGSAYLTDLQLKLGSLRQKILDRRVHYVVFCHGADSHIDDDLGAGVLTTSEWLESAKIFYTWVKELDRIREECLPLAMALYGGYQRKDYRRVLELHAADLAICLGTLTERHIKFDLRDRLS